MLTAENGGNPSLIKNIIYLSITYASKPNKGEIATARESREILDFPDPFQRAQKNPPEWTGGSLCRRC